jgi:transposase
VELRTGNAALAQGLGLKVAQRSGHKKAVAAVARKLAVIMYAMWREDTEFRFSDTTATA